jgi:predicted tellurium resistance membrane protein TerC
VLSADNAIALAALAQRLEDPKLQAQALNIGLVVAYVLRISLILTATWVTKFWQFELLGSAYLLWLAWQYFSAIAPGVSSFIYLGFDFTLKYFLLLLYLNNHSNNTIAIEQ